MCIRDRSPISALAEFLLTKVNDMSLRIECGDNKNRYRSSSWRVMYSAAAATMRTSGGKPFQNSDPSRSDSKQGSALADKPLAMHCSMANVWSICDQAKLATLRVDSRANFQLPQLQLTYHTCIWRLCCGWFRLSFAEIFGNRKLESLGYRVALFAWSYV